MGSLFVVLSSWFVVRGATFKVESQDEVRGSWWLVACANSFFHGVDHTVQSLPQTSADISKMIALLLSLESHVFLHQQEGILSLQGMPWLY
jgi:uncharacterized membrane protein